MDDPFSDFSPDSFFRPPDWRSQLARYLVTNGHCPPGCQTDAETLRAARFLRAEAAALFGNSHSWVHERLPGRS